MYLKSDLNRKALSLHPKFRKVNILTQPLDSINFSNWDYPKVDWASGKANKLIKWDLEWFADDFIANRWDQLNKVCSWGITTKFHDSIKSNEGWSIYQFSDKHKLVLSRSVPSSSSSIIAYSQIESLIDTLWTQGPQYLVLCTCTVARIYVVLKTSQGSYLWFHVYYMHTEIHARNETAI